jgi:hypothetical protein
VKQTLFFEWTIFMTVLMERTTRATMEYSAIRAATLINLKRILCGIIFCLKLCREDELIEWLLTLMNGGIKAFWSCVG